MSQTKDDGARLVSRCSERCLNTDQVRQLRALKDGKPVTRDIIKERQKMRGKYSSHWLKALWELKERKLITITVDKAMAGHTQHIHKITALGKKTLAKAEKEAKLA